MTTTPKIGRRDASRGAVPLLPVHAVPRPRIRMRLEAAVTDHLKVSVVAETGSGKSTAVADWVATTGWTTVWLTVRAAHRKPRAFWAAVARVLLPALLPGSGPRPTDPDEITVESLGASLRSRTEPVVLILDDYYHASDNVIHDLDGLILASAGALRVVVVARPTPSIAASRLHLAGHTDHVRAADLACTAGEARDILGRLGLTVSAGSLAHLMAHTEGWIAGLVIAGQAALETPDPDLHLSDFSGADRAVRAYLTAEVLGRLPPNTVRALRAVSIVDEMDPEVTQHLTGSPHAGADLEAWAGSGLFLRPIDPRGAHYRFPRLVRDALRAEFAATDPCGLATAHSSAAQWFRSRGNPSTALDHSLAAGDLELAATIATTSWLDIMQHGELDTLAPLLELAPHQQVQAHPELTMALAAISLQLESEPHTTRRMQRLTPLAPSRRTAEPPTARLILDLMAARAAGDAAGTRRAADRLLSDSASAAKAPAELRSLILSIVGTAESWTGDVTRARDHLQAAMAAAHEAGSTGSGSSPPASWPKPKPNAATSRAPCGTSSRPSRWQRNAAGCARPPSEQPPSWEPLSPPSNADSTTPAAS